MNNKLAGLLSVMILSLAFQLALHGYAGDDRAVPPDSPLFLSLAVQIEAALDGTGKLEGHVTRTPGYPALLYVAGRSAGIELADVRLPIRNWTETNAEGRALVHRVVLFQQILGFTIPPLIYLIVLSLGGSVLLSLLASLAYFFDPRVVTFQYVLMTETLSLAVMLVAMLLFVLALRRRSAALTALAGVAMGILLVVRPPLLVLAVVLCGAAVLMLRHYGAGAKGTARWLVHYLAVAAILPLGWSLANYHSTGHFFYTMNGTITLQNFTDELFVQMEVDDPELQVVQRHAAAHLERAATTGIKPFETYAYWRTVDAVREELGTDDFIHVMKLGRQANWMVIRAHPWEFLAGGLERAYRTWFQPFGNVKNQYAVERLREFGVIGKLLSVNAYMLLGPATLVGFLFLVPLAARGMPADTRIFFFSLAAFAIMYSFAVALMDENEVFRHAMQMRIVVNGMLLAAGGILVRRLVEAKLSRRATASA